MSCPNSESGVKLTAESEEPDAKKLKLELELTIEAILPDRYTEELKLTKVLVGFISDPKEAGNLTRNLPKLSLNHLKRIKNTAGVLQIILCELEDNIEDLTQVKEQFKFKGLGSVAIAQVPSTVPLTIKQSKTASEFWPVNFHPNNSIEKLFQHNCGFSEGELVEIMKNVQLIKTDDPTCVIYDPVIKEVLVVATGLEKQYHPLKHAAIRAIDAIAELHRGSQSQFFIATGTPKVTATSSITRNRHQDYICTNLDVYLTQEPCLMCATALLHSRVEGIFYLNPNPTRGVLESNLKLHCLDKINHRFEVFKVRV
jgi:tRNA-specific adenosine deaminase 3